MTLSARSPSEREWGMGNECPTHPKRIFSTCGELSGDMFAEFVSGDSQISPRVSMTVCGLTRTHVKKIKKILNFDSSYLQINSVDRFYPEQPIGLHLPFSFNKCFSTFF